MREYAIFRELITIFALEVKLSCMKLNRIKTVLVEKDMSQTKLANELGMSFSTINAYCCNRQQPSLELLYKISEILSVSVRELLFDNKKTV